MLYYIIFTDLVQREGLRNVVRSVTARLIEYILFYRYSYIMMNSDDNNNNNNIIRTI